MELAALTDSPPVGIRNLVVETPQGLQNHSSVTAAFAPGWLFIEVTENGITNVEAIPAHRVVRAEGLNSMKRKGGGFLSPSPAAPRPAQGRGAAARREPLSNAGPLEHPGIGERSDLNGYPAVVPEHLSRAVADQVRRLLAERGMSGRQLALASGINPRSIDRKLSNASPWDVDDLAAIAPALGVTAADLIVWAERS